MQRNQKNNTFLFEMNEGFQQKEKERLAKEKEAYIAQELKKRGGISNKVTTDMMYGAEFDEKNKKKVKTNPIWQENEIFNTMSESNHINDVDDDSQSLQCHDEDQLKPKQKLVLAEINKAQIVMGQFFQAFQELDNQQYPHYTASSFPSEVKLRVSELHKLFVDQAQATVDSLRASRQLMETFVKQMKVMGSVKKPKSLICLTKNGNPRTYTEEERNQIKQNELK